nr:MBL fold metallo-hydrolase [Allomuricauda sp.]
MAKKITSCDIQMYTMGTGDCFVLGFKGDGDNKPQFKLMIDCGVQSISGDNMRPYALKIIEETDGEVDALLITHEHQDHVLGFQRCEDEFSNQFKVKELWLPWTEDEDDALVKEWKDEFGKKKKSLAMATELLAKNTNSDLFQQIYNVGPRGERSFNARKGISTSLMELSNLNTEPFAAAGDYIGGLKGMTVVKEKIPRDRLRFLETGTILEDIEGLDNIRIYILGPPRMWKDVKTHHGKNGETYKHNKELEFVRGFSALPFEEEDSESDPFEKVHIVEYNASGNATMYEKPQNKAYNKIRDIYTKPENSFRRINFDWLMSAANLSLRLTKGMNNLSAVLAIEFVESGKVMLFPGDAEFGSWRSWHEIEWDEKGKDGQTHLTKDLLNRTVFYKVAHHLSHNGTARELGMDLMTNKDLVAMATLDYDVISPTWKNTMPNRALLNDLLKKTSGRLIVTNPDNQHVDKAKTIKLTDEINKRLENLSQVKQDEYKVVRNDLFVQYTVDGS